jgi:hypothetical protein
MEIERSANFWFDKDTSGHSLSWCGFRFRNPHRDLYHLLADF